MNQRKKLILIAVIIALVLMVIYIAGIFITEDMLAVDFSRINQKPSFAHPFGTDWMGRDLFLRTVKGLSLSIMVGVIASFFSAVFATLVGIAAATGSKIVDETIKWLIDLVMSIPHLILIILISFSLGKGLRGLMVGIILTHWTGLARLIRAEVMQIRSQVYIAVSRKLGKSNRWILLNHILPHLVPQFIVGLVLLFPHAILHEASISFLGYGLAPEKPAIGIILSESMRYISAGHWWLALCPGAVLVVIVILFDRMGDVIKNIIDPTCAQE